MSARMETVDAALTTAIHNADIYNLQEIFSQYQVSALLKRRWDELTKFAKTVYTDTPMGMEKRLCALAERIRLERTLQELLQVFTSKQTTGGYSSRFGSPMRMGELVNGNGSNHSKDGSTSDRGSGLRSPPPIRLRPQQIISVSEGHGIYYKTVAVMKGRYFSVFDGVTEYTIGTSVYKRFTGEKMSGIFVYRSISEAVKASFPKESRFLSNRRVILKVKASGAVRIHGRKLAFEVVKPVGVVCELPSES
ncbi:hypothetical protein AAMO2058_000021800 [Amorphochlora amoebiformis]